MALVPTRRVWTLAAFLLAAPAFAQGTLTGTVVDGDLGESLPGANVLITELGTGGATTLDGTYRITSVPAGTYTLRVSFIGFTPQVVQNVTVRDGETTTLNVVMAAGTLGEVVVEAEALAETNSEVGLLRVRQRAIAVSDAISAEAISRAGAGTAAEALGRVTGASIVGGRYVYVRGLGDRYVNTQLNGALLPSADPDRNAVPLDLFPSDLLENIVTAKTFTPDQPGNFSGGSVNVSTQSFPTRPMFTFSASSGYNELATFATAPRGLAGGTDWLGIDDGLRAIPDAWAAPGVRVPAISQARSNPDSAAALNALARAFSSELAPATAEIPLNRSLALSAGNQFRLAGRPLGVIGSLTYSQSYNAYAAGTSAQYVLRGAVADNDALDVNYRLADARSTREVLWGGLGSLSFAPSSNHTLGLTGLYNRGGNSEARIQTGVNPKDFNTTERFLETRTLGWTERSLGSVQGRGEHRFPGLRAARAEWTASFARTDQDEPDLRFFANDFTVGTDDDGAVVDTSYNITPSNYTLPSRYFRSLREDATDVRLQLAVPLAEAGPLAGTLRLGAAYTDIGRRFRERLFQYEAVRRYDGDPAAYFSDAFTGVVDTVDTVFGREFVIGNYVRDRSSPRNNYDGAQQVTAAFAMAELRPAPRVRAVVGARIEATRQTVASQDPTTLINPLTGEPTDGEIRQTDLLPSANLVYELTPAMNLRAGYSRTLARPTFRELAPFSSFEFIGDYVVNGNPDLERTLIGNADLRWEWFTRPGEILAVSLFHKAFSNPIERAILSNNNQVQFQNVPSARVVGAEFEARRRVEALPLVPGALEAGANLTLTQSEVDVPEREQTIIRQFDPSLSELRVTRPLQGQSPFVANVDLTYLPAAGTSATVLLNVYGARLSNVSLGGTPNEYEFTTATLDLTFKQRLGWGTSLSVSASNLLGEDTEFGYTYRDVRYVTRQYERGRSFSVGLSYALP